MPRLTSVDDFAVHLDRCSGRLPELWDRNVHYFANVREMFFGNESQIRELQERVGGVQCHGGRFVPVLNLMFQGGGENVLYLEREPDPALVDHFQRLGLSLPTVQVLAREDYVCLEKVIGQIAQGTQRWIDGYVTDKVLDSLAGATGKRTISSYQASRRGNNKRVLHEFLERNDLPVFTTFYAEAPSEIDGCLDRLRAMGFASAVVKSAIGASGVGMKRTTTAPGQREVIPESFFFEGPCLVQGWLDLDASGIEEILSPSVQVFLKDDVISVFDLTEQFLSGDSVFKGNECPPSYLNWRDHVGLRDELLRQAEIVARWLYDLGLRGPASVDFVVTREREDFTVYVCEANARVTGATYPSLLARHFHEGGAWVMRNLKFTHPMPTAELLNILSLHGYLYEPGKSQGLLPYNLYTCDHGRVEQGQFLVMAPEITTCKGLLIEAERDLPIDWEYERA